MGSLIMGQIVTVPGLQWTVSSDDPSAGSGPLFWIYVDKQGRWCLRKEGDETDAFFGSRAEALPSYGVWRAARPTACSSKRTTARSCWSSTRPCPASRPEATPPMGCRFPPRVQPQNVGQ
jgi:hypothetical protein